MGEMNLPIVPYGDGAGAQIYSDSLDGATPTMCHAAPCTDGASLITAPESRRALFLDIGVSSLA